MENEGQNLADANQSEVIRETPIIPSPNKDTNKNQTALIVGASIICASAIAAFAYIYVETGRPVSEPHLDDLDSLALRDIEENESDVELDDYNIESWALGEVDKTKDGDSENSDKDTRKYDYKSDVLEVDKRDYSAYYSDTVNPTGVKWFDSPILLEDLNIIDEKHATSMVGTSVRYLQLGTYSEQPLIMMAVEEYGMMSREHYIFLFGSGEFGYYIIPGWSDDYMLEKIQFAEIVKGKNDSLPPLYPEEVEMDGTVYKTSSLDDIWYGGLFAESAYADKEDAEDTEEEYVIEFVTKTPYGPIFRSLRKKSDYSADLSYALRLQGGLLVPISGRLNFVSDDRVPQITFINGEKNTESYRTDGLSSCGWGGPEVMLERVEPADMALAGYTPDHEPIYQLVNANHILIDRVFGGKQERRVYDYDSTVGETTKYTINRNEFITNYGVLIYEDNFGFQHVLTNTKYGPQAECAKPVVYLYPAEKTDVRVELDALVTVSEPKYGSGWDVVAEPDGTLTVGGVEYDSLFWDGYGNGEYPEITKGYVVKTENVMSLIEQQMAYMNFNEKEIRDFVEFWTPHMPEEMYTRFTWLLTTDMERLAKLSIEPKPDTLIRVFLDYEGLTEPIEIETQKLPRIEREGFVATEWGGLLRR